MAWRNTVIVLPAFSVLRHRGATAHRPEPKRVLLCVAESEARLAIGLQVVFDNSGPAAADKGNSQLQS